MVSRRETSAENHRIPAMPVADVEEEFSVAHREKIEEEPWNPFQGWAMISRPVRKAELMKEPAAQRAVQLEWEKLRKAECWDEVHVREWVEVSAEAKMYTENLHVARLVDTCMPNCR